jgi:hypothetical protein
MLGEGGGGDDRDLDLACWDWDWDCGRRCECGWTWNGDLPSGDSSGTVLCTRGDLLTRRMVGFREVEATRGLLWITVKEGWVLECGRPRLGVDARVEFGNDDGVGFGLGLGNGSAKGSCAGFGLGLVLVLMPVLKLVVAVLELGGTSRIAVTSRLLPERGICTCVGNDEDTAGDLGRS